MTTAWTWLVYVATDSSAGGNLGISDVSSQGKKSIKKITGAERGSKVRVLIQQDISVGARRYEVGVDEAHPIYLNRIDSGDPKTMGEFLRWGIEKAPAERYAVVIWSHGSGWQPDYRASAERSSAATPPPYFSTTSARIVQSGERAVAGDNGSGNAIDTLELGDLLNGVTSDTGHKIDLLVMNACQMASVEVAYQLRNSVDYYLATEVMMPTESLPYDLILSALGAEPEISTEDLSRLMVKHYCASMRLLSFPQGAYDTPGASMTALRPGAMGALTEAVQKLGAALHADLYAQRLAMHNAVRDAPGLEELRAFRIGDMRRFCNMLISHKKLGRAARAAAKKVIAALAQDGPIIVDRETTASADGVSAASVLNEHAGLTTFLPPYDPDSISIVPTFYMQTEYSRDTGWGDLLREWHTKMMM